MENNEKDLKKLLAKLQDDILDEYNKGEISYGEMVKIMTWTEKIIDSKIKYPNAKTLIIDLRERK